MQAQICKNGVGWNGHGCLDVFYRSQHRLEADAEVVLQLDPKLQNALIQSQRVGDLLLKSEEKELAQVDKLADDLLEREYRYTGQIIIL
jgi:hypothetical protein